MPKNTDPEDLKAAIRKTGNTCVGLSIEIGYSPAAVAMALRRRWHEPRVAIAKLLGKSLHALWPEDYGEDDEPFGHRPRTRDSGIPEARRRQKTSRKLAA